MKRHVLVLAVATAAAVASLPLTSASAAERTEKAAADRNPVVFVHGYGGTAADIGAIKQSFLDGGYAESDLHSLDFPDTQKNEQTAEQLKTEVDRILAASGAAKVDLVGFSMGSLSSRYYLKNLSGTDKVAHFASVAGPNHGTSLANFCWLTGDTTVCPQMAPGSDFLKKLNEGDETPGSTDYETWASHGDTTITPPESIALNGAENHWTKEDTDHVGTLTNKEVQQGIIAQFTG
ncbi:alpha/beta fold hydrolase [Streptomyces sp. NA04227]|uniref:esterase/lipase family protein n=1 Tax=Streptomyces sp. NA04227 TaxID=2742136 RepID=UPI001591E6AE|nr:alpha/beta fold hydrolase [Streptomyces sp. NA04227]QKW08400.1 alpha/beta fold hydrolase [Streptomyces sp. NA04227]